MAATLKKAKELGGKIVQPAQQVPGTTFGVFADAHGHKVGVAANSWMIYSKGSSVVVGQE
ncbi:MULTISPECIES: hypothetical protein [Kribbella]|uniref:hypothetical protein n=1 Tax=Kribbella TaxID=182639 RepID=UPI00104FE263|nr:MULTISPECIES: hypothetical protein [Kribbella]